MVPFAVQDGAACLIRGFASPRHAVSREELDQLIAAGHAQSLREPLPAPEADLVLSDAYVVALWVGTAFELDASVTEITVAGMKRMVGEVAESFPTLPFAGEGGRFALVTAKDAYSWLENWTLDAFFTYRRTGDTRLAKLMAQVLPDHETTLAVRWATSPDPDRELRRQLNIWRRGEDAAKLQAKHAELLAFGHSGSEFVRKSS